MIQDLSIIDWLEIVGVSLLLVLYFYIMLVVLNIRKEIKEIRKTRKILSEEEAEETYIPQSSENVE
jgi:hypothetical protein